MLTINIHEAKTHLSRFVEQAAAGEEIIIAKAGKPIARLVPLQSLPRHRNLGMFEGRLHAKVSSLAMQYPFFVFVVMQDLTPLSLQDLTPLSLLANLQDLKMTI